MSTKPDPTDLLAVARAAAVDILTEHAGRALLSDLLAIAYLRGHTAAHKDIAALPALNPRPSPTMTVTSGHQLISRAGLSTTEAA